MNHRQFIQSLLLLPILMGCSKEKLDELAARTKAATSDAAAQLKKAGNDMMEQTSDAMETSQQTLKKTTASLEDALPGSGVIELQTDPPLETSIGRWTVHEFKPRNGSAKRVVELTSYRTDESLTSFPAVMMRTVLDGSGTVMRADLSDRKWQLFAQLTEDDAVWSGEVSMDLDLDMSSQQLTGFIRSSKLTSTDERDVSLQGGRIDCKWIAPNKNLP
ncbi:MAG: hypothetical protein AAF745_04435 [Planctomycetota bacterium]